MNDKIGFMQGRLSPLVGGKIQAFPWDTWQNEFPAAQNLGLKLMEWTLDSDRLYQNPLLKVEGRQEIRALCELNRLFVPSLTGDCFMQAPFWKARGRDKKALETDFINIAHACADIGMQTIVVPLVDNGALKDQQQEDGIIAFMLAHVELFRALGLCIVFESDYTPVETARFIGRLPVGTFGINYDIGNSAAIGYDPAEEFEAYGERVLNVHVKDRLLHGTTVPLGEGNADFKSVFDLLYRQCYQGNFIMQTARSQEGEHGIVLGRYRALVDGWLADALSPGKRIGL